MQNLTPTTRWADFVTSEPPIMARDANKNLVGSEWKGNFLDIFGLSYLQTALIDASLKYSMAVDPAFTVEQGESRWPYLIRIQDGETSYDFEPKQILSVLLAGVPGKLTFRAGQFGFIPDPVAPPAPRPNSGPTTGSDFTSAGNLPPGVDTGAFTAADRALLWRIAGKLGAL